MAFDYARQNLALVHVYVKRPVVTKIVRDQRIPVIWFVANCGGILGLCMGFSIVTVFEVLHYLANCLIELARRGRCYAMPTAEASTGHCDAESGRDQRSGAVDEGKEDEESAKG